MAQGLDRPVVDPDLLKPRMKRKDPVYSIQEERGAQLLWFYSGFVDKEGPCLRVSGEEVIRERTDINKEHAR